MDGEKKCWVVIYSHNHGVDAWPLFQAEAPTESQVKKQLIDEQGDEFDEDSEWIEIRGPWDEHGNRSVESWLSDVPRGTQDGPSHPHDQEADS